MSANQSIITNKGGLQQIWAALTTSVTGKRDYAALAYRRNPDSFHDEALIIGWVVLTACIIGTGAYGIYYHYQIFSHAFSTWAIVSGIISCAIFLLGEVMKVGATLLLLRLLFTGNWNKSPQMNLLTLGLLLLSIGTFVWSYKISTESTSAINQAVKTEELRKGINYDPATYTSAIDSQLVSINADIKRLNKIKTSKGEITWPAQKAIEKAQSTKSKLLDDRRLAESRYQSQQDSSSTAALTIIQTASKQLGEYGQWFEIVALICLVGLIAPCESIGYAKAKKQAETDHQPTPVEPVATSSPQPQPTDFSGLIANSIDQYFQSRKPVTVAGFQQSHNQAPTPPPPVGENCGTVVATTPTAFSPQPTAHSPQVITATELVEDIELQIIAQLDRFGKYYPSKWNARGAGGGKPETIAYNLKNALEVSHSLMGEGFGLSPKTYDRYLKCKREFETNVEPHIKTTKP